MSAALKLELFQNGALLREIPVEGKVLWLGRGEECAIRLDDRAISRKHAELRISENGIEFLKKSKFGEVRMGGREIEHATLRGGECLALGPFELRVVCKEAEAPLTVAGESIPVQDPAGALPGRGADSARRGDPQGIPSKRGVFPGWIGCGRSDRGRRCVCRLVRLVPGGRGGPA